ncbi:MAG: hypothetical protein Q8P57_02400 [Candidatus Pacearchaeota archaeon]|nr:hypothetical protein [Candidatus Pacearchaeota archaeon]
MLEVAFICISNFDITNLIEISEGGLEITFTSEEREYALTLREGYFRANYNEENCNRQSAITFTGNSPAYFPEIGNFPHMILTFSTMNPPREYFTLQDYESLRQFLITNFTNYWSEKINSPDARNKP